MCHSTITNPPLTKSKLVTATVEGILSCLTATFWGSVRALINPSHRIPPETLNRYGRVEISWSATLPLYSWLTPHSPALTVAPEHVPGGYWFLLLASAFEGLIGGKCRLPRVWRIQMTIYCLAGRSAAIAALHAYLADCSSPATRSAFVLSCLNRSLKPDDADPRIFSRFLGLVFIGVALGPSLGGIAERLSGNFAALYSTLRLACTPSMLFFNGSSSPSHSYLRRWTQHGALDGGEARAIVSAAFSASSALSRCWRPSLPPKGVSTRGRRSRRTGPLHGWRFHWRLSHC